MVINIIGALIVLAAAIFIAWPLLIPAPGRTRIATPAPDQGASRARLEAERDRALAALREARVDHATGKITEDDYATMRAELEGTALDAITALDTLTGAAGEITKGKEPVESVEGFCGACGAPRIPGARFCGECGTALPPGPQRSTG